MDSEKLYQEYAKTVYSFLYHLSQDKDIAEDLMQETFCNAIKSLHTYDGTCKINVWLCQIAKHLWYNELRRKTKYKYVELDEHMPSPMPSPDIDYIQKSEKLTLYEAIHYLNEPMKEVVYLRITGDFSFAEIGKIMNKSESWARLTYYRAKQKLMEVIK